ncbi:MAG TPA: CHRD domain-containing protein [Actinomycetota bacterium]
MRRRSIGIVITLGALTALLLAPSTEAAQRFELAMTGAEEAPGPGDPDGTGTASFTFNRGLGEVCFSLEVEDILLPTIGAHIHVAPAGSPGPVVIPLTPPGADGTSSGCVSADRELVKAITKDPASYYVNVHTTDFPGGAARAQLG